MEATRPSLHGDLEVGYADVIAKHTERAPAHHQPLPGWLVAWEDRLRPRLLSEMFAESFGVFLYVFCGVGASSAFFLSSAAKESGFGDLLTIGLGYALGIVLAIILCGPASGGHLSPCFTIAFWLFKGFPARKVPFYIVAQIFGGFLGAITVYGIYKQQFDAVTAALTAEGAAGIAAIYSPQGPAGTLALFPAAGQDLKYALANEFVATIILGIVVFSVLDSSNIFISFASAPFVIGLAYAVIIWGFAINSLSLNTARDLGGRLAAACIWGRGVFPPGYSALAALTNLLGTQIGALLQILFLSDSARPTVNNLPDPDGPSLRAISRDPLDNNPSLRAVSRDQNLAEKRV